MTTREIQTLAREIVRQIARITNQPKCEWVTEGKALQELPLTKNQLTKFRANGTLNMGYHYKSIGKEISKDGSSRGRKTILYHEKRMVDFVNSFNTGHPIKRMA
jgi:hypothetical protein